MFYCYNGPNNISVALDLFLEGFLFRVRVRSHFAHNNNIHIDKSFRFKPFSILFYAVPGAPHAHNHNKDK